MSQFEDFEQEYGPPADCVVPDEATLRRYEGLLPAELLAHWREHGWCAYRSGLLRLVDPGDFADVIGDWFDVEPEARPLVFLRTAFAHLYFWHDNAVYSLDVHHGTLSQVTKRIHRIFTLLCDPEIKTRIIRAPMFEEAVRTLGPPARDECYAFVPALALGGPGTVETLQRVKLREHLGILAQIAR